jgi:hypothetical protein
VIVHIVAYRLHSGSTWRRRVEQRPREVVQPVDLAVAAAQQKQHRLVGQVVHRVLDGVRRMLVDEAVIADDEIDRQRQTPGRRQRLQMLP